MRENRAGLVESVLGRPVSVGTNGGSESDNTLYVFQARNTGWLVARDGSVIVHTRDRESFERFLRRLLQSMVVERLPTSVLLPGRLIPRGNDRILEIPVSLRNGGDSDRGTAKKEDRAQAPSASGEEPKLLLLPDAAALGAEWPWRGRGYIGMQVIPAADMSPTRVVLRERSPNGEAEAATISRAAAIPWVVASGPKLGPDTSPSLDLLLDALGTSASYQWLGRPGGVNEFSEYAPPRPDDSFDEECAEFEKAAMQQLLDFESAMPTAAPGLLVREIDGAWLAVSPEASTTILLNEQAVVLLRLFDGRTSLHDIAAVAADVFSEDTRVIEARMRPVIEAFYWNGIVVDVRD